MNSGLSKLNSTFLVVLICLLTVFSGVARAQQKYAELDAKRVQEIAGMLTAQPAGFGAPCSDRATWTALAPKLESSIAQAEQAMKTPLPAFDPEGYLAFTRTGDRAPMERNLHSREERLVPLVLAECVEYKGRFLPAIAEVMDSLVAMPSWTLSAHDGQLMNFHGTRYYVDLNAADMGDTLAQSMYLLGDKIPADTRERVTAGMEKHVFGPMRQSYLGGASNDRNGHWWLLADMNWNAVCLKGVTGAALAMLPGADDRAMFVAGAEHYIQHYDNGFQPDGYDPEGLGYWNYGFSHFIELRENLIRATSGKLDLLASDKMKKVALFGAEFPMMPGNAAAFGDAHFMPEGDPHLMAIIAHIFQIPGSPAAPLESTGISHVGLTSLSLDLFPIRGDQLPTPGELSRHELQTYYADTGVLVSRPGPGQDFAVTIKAGGNTTHSHNDIGSYVLGVGKVEPLGEPGGPNFYNADTFNSHRLEHKLMNSFAHPVPEIGGHFQLDATTVKPTMPEHRFSAAEDLLTIDMTNAYSVPELKQVTRTLVHKRAGDGSVEITDKFELTSATEIIESIPTHGTWEKIDDHTLLFKFDGAQVRAVIKAPVPVTTTETKVNEYNNPLTRVEVHVPLAGSGKFSVLFTPVK